MNFLKLTMCLVMLAGAGYAQDKRTMTVVGQGDAQVVPDMAVVTLGVSSFAPMAAEALSMNSEDMKKLFEVIENAGVNSKDVQTSQLSLNPRWDRRSNNETPPAVIGYEANNTVTVRLRDIDMVGAVLDQLAQAGANRIQNIAFDVQNPRPHQDAARKAAVADAQAKARLYADAAGIELGQVLSISEQSVSGPVPVQRMARAMAAESVPIAQGEVELNASVTVIYELN